MLLSVAGCFSGCKVLNEARQVRTYASMQTIVSRLEAIKADREQSFKAKSRGVIASEANGLDQWGNPFVLIVKDNEGSRYSYVLISRGSDGQLDVASPDVYFDEKEEFILGQPERDIVFRDGLPLKNAGK